MGFPVFRADQAKVVDRTSFDFAQGLANVVSPEVMAIIAAVKRAQGLPELIPVVRG